MKKGYEWLSGEYRGLCIKSLELRHSCGEVFVGNFSSVVKKGGHPCPQCNLRKAPKEAEADGYAKQHDGKLVVWSGKAKVPSVWECSKGHRWAASWGSMNKEKAWCMKCEYASRVKYSTEDDKWAAKKFNEYKSTDRKYKRENDLSFEDFVGLRARECVYCGRPPTGFDRLDCSVGHLKSNVVPCCWRCNRVRCDMLSHEVMLEVGAVLRRLDP